MARPKTKDLALVMTGGGARAAYQVGFLRCLARHYPELTFPLLTGVSAGAINAAFLAARQGTFANRVEALSELWSRLEIQHVFKVAPSQILRNIFGWGFRLLGGGRGSRPRSRALLDTKPLGKLLTRELQAKKGMLHGVQQNIDSGWLRAVAITTSSYTTGQSITWVQGSDILNWEKPKRRGIQCELGVQHIMASASLPMLFPAVQIDDSWYGDGGIRLTTPLAPSVHLGAEKILVISTTYARTVEEADAVSTTKYPPPAQVAGVLLNAVFLDQLDADAERLDQRNQLIEKIPQAKRGDLKPVDILILRPSQDIGLLANKYESKLPRTFRFMMRGLGTKENESNDLLSLLMFQPEFLVHLIEMGEADAEERLEEIRAFMGPAS